MAPEELRLYLDRIAEGIRREIKITSEGVRAEVRQTNYRITEMDTRVRNVEAMCAETRTNIANLKEDVQKQEREVHWVQRRIAPLLNPHSHRRESDPEDESYLHLRGGDRTLRTVLMTVLKTVAWIGMAALGAAQLFQAIK